MIKEAITHNHLDIDHIPILFLIGVSTFLLNFIWTTKFKKIIFSQNHKPIKASQDSHKLKPLFDDKKSIDMLYQLLIKQLKYMDCSIEVFTAFIKQEPIMKSQRIIWLQKSRTNKLEINRQTLFEFITQVFPCIVSESRYKRTKLQILVLYYFRDTNKQDITTIDSTISKWKKERDDSNITSKAVREIKEIFQEYRN